MTIRHKILLATLVSVLLAGRLGAEPSQDDVRFLETFVENELAMSVTRRPLYVIGYTIENSSDHTITYLKISIVGRNQKDQIVEIHDRQVFYSGSLPQGFQPGEQIVQRHGMEVTNPTENVTSIDLSVIEIR